MQDSIPVAKQVQAQEPGQGFEVIDMEAWEAVHGGGSMSGSHTHHTALTELIVPSDLGLGKLATPVGKLPL